MNWLIKLQQGKGRKGKSRKGQNQENDQFENGDQQGMEEQEGQEEGVMNEGEEMNEEGGEPQRKGEARPNQIEKIAKKVLGYLDERTADMDKDTLAKYAAVGVLLLAGMRKSGFLGGLAVSLAAGLITKHIVETSGSSLEEEGKGQEEGVEDEIPVGA